MKKKRKYISSPYKELGLKANFIMSDLDEKKTDKNDHLKKKFDNRTLKGFENF